MRSHKHVVRAGDTQGFGYASEQGISVVLLSICHDNYLHGKNSTMYVNDI